ncbi:MAG: polyprenyl diphosphate synthase [Candidatus Pacearchaeota archaeon]|jgi:undecaprenyl diphosphate synthase
MVENKLNHIGIILDGNRRFAKRLMLEPWKGHELGFKKLEKILGWLKEIGVREFTLYCFSLENFNRPKIEFDFLMKIFKEAFEMLKNDKRVYEEGIKLNFIGKRELFDKDLQAKIKELEEMTKNHNNYIINFALGYGGRQEIIEAIKKLVKNNEEINEENFQKNLWLNRDIDLIIRTGGEKRTSNFLPWQSTYAEWIFLDKMWPEFEKQDLLNCIEEFKNRKRNFGK